MSRPVWRPLHPRDRCINAVRDGDTGLAIAVCPGLAIASKLAGGVENLLSCQCPEAKRLLQNPYDYVAGVEAGIACKTRCQKKLESTLDNIRNHETRKHAEDMLRRLRKRRMRVEKVIGDVELAHIVVNLGCGHATITCSPAGCVLSDAHGVSFDTETLTARCDKSPPYLKIGEYLYLTGV